jgi:hypothetical protein
MAKVTAPFLSLAARGTVGKAITASAWKGLPYMRVRVIPKKSMLPAPIAIRALIKDITQAWKNETSPIDSAYKAAYDLVAVGKAYSGFNVYVKDSVGKNWISNDYNGSLDIPTAPGDNLP